MSQAKVDQYKKEKANRRQRMRKEKINRLICLIVGIVIAAAILVWIGYSVFDSLSSSSDTGNNPSVEVNTDAVDNYLDSLDDAE